MEFAEPMDKNTFDLFLHLLYYYMIQYKRQEF